MGEYSRDDLVVSMEIYAVPKYNATVVLALDLFGVNASEPHIQTKYYNITEKTDRNGNDLASISMRLQCNTSTPLHFFINELKAGGGCEFYSVYYDLKNNATKDWSVRTYFSSFIAVYSVRVKRVFGLVELPIYRDAYHYAKGPDDTLISSSPEPNHYSTDRVPLVLTILCLCLSLMVLGLLLSTTPEFITVAEYYPWVTLGVVSLSILVYILWTPAEFLIYLSPCQILLSYSLHFNGDHLIGNLQSGLVILFLLETVVGYGLKIVQEMRWQILVTIAAMDFVFWIIGALRIFNLAGYGASFVNEVLGAMLMADVVAFRKDLTSSEYRLLAYPLVCMFAGYALFSYVVGWFVNGYVFNYDLEGAERHLTAFLLGLPWVLYETSKTWKKSAGTKKNVADALVSESTIP